MPQYVKTASGLYRGTEHLLNRAKTNAARALADARETQQPNPSTEMHELVDYLQSLKTPNS